MKILMLLISFLFLRASVGTAQNDETEESRASAEKAKRRQYPGGRDEQELTVQAVLPQTTRYPEAPKATVAPVPEFETDTHD